MYCTVYCSKAYHGVLTSLIGITNHSTMTYNSPNLMPGAVSVSSTSTLL